MAALEWLDARRRAMLREMGIRVWHALPALSPSAAINPEPVVLVQAEDPPDTSRVTSRVAAHTDARATADFAPELIAARAGLPSVADTIGLKKEASSPAAEFVQSVPTQTHVAWALGPLQSVQAPFVGDLIAASPANPGGVEQPGGFAPMSPAPRWLVICEMPTLNTDPLGEGLAGQLLRNMLQAMHQGLQRLQSAHATLAENPAAHAAPVVQLAAWAPVQAARPSSSSPLQQQLAQVVAGFQPDAVLLLMGRSAAMALLAEAQSMPPGADFAALPFNQLRAQPHALHGCVALLSYELAVLLRTPARKAQAWEDMSQLLQLSQQAAQARRQ